MVSLQGTEVCFFDFERFKTQKTTRGILSPGLPLLQNNKIKKFSNINTLQHVTKRWKTGISELITRRSLVQVQPPQPQNRLISQEIRRFFFTFCLKKFSEKLCGFAKFAVDPNRDPDGSKNRPGGGVSASGSSCFWERFWGIYNAAIRTLSMALAASFWAAVVTWA